MFTDLNVDQKALAEAMSEISEAAWYAEWMLGLEYALWNLLTTGETRYGRSKLTTDELARLRVLSAKCGGWIFFDDEKEETFVPLDEWKRMFEERPSQYRRL